MVTTPGRGRQGLPGDARAVEEETSGLLGRTDDDDSDGDGDSSADSEEEDEDNAGVRSNSQARARARAQGPPCKEGAIRVSQRCVDDVVEMMRYIAVAVGEAAIGDFISEPGKNPLEADLIIRCRWRLIASLDLADLPFDQALRKLLTKSGFRLPGEA